MTPDRSHGSPYDRGDSVAYQGGYDRPHKWTFERGWGYPTRHYDLTPQEVVEFNLGFDENPSGKKCWT